METQEALAAAPPPRGGRHLFTLHSYLFRQQGIDLLSCPSCTPLLFFSMRRRRGAPCTVEEKKRLWCKPSPCRASIRCTSARWQVWQKSGANQNAPPFSFRCRSPGACRRAVVYTRLFERSHGENLKGRCKHPASERAVGDAGASQVCTKRLNSCRLAKEHLSEHGTGLVCTPALFFSYTVHGAPLLLRMEKKRRGVHLGQESKSLPCWRKR